MNDRSVSLLEQYELEVLHTRKGRGAILCETDQGLLIFKEYGGNPEHLKLQNIFLQHLSQKSEVQAEGLIPTKEGELFVKDNDGMRYVLKTYRDGRECNLHEKSDCLQAVRLLAKLHLASPEYHDISWGDLEMEAAEQSMQGMKPRFKVRRNTLSGTGSSKKSGNSCSPEARRLGLSCLFWPVSTDSTDRLRKPWKDGRLIWRACGGSEITYSVTAITLITIFCRIRTAGL